MAVRIRLTRAGRRHVPFYHICVYDKAQRRDGREVERLGFYDPANVDAEHQVRVDTERASYWLDNGATPSETVAGILKGAGVAVPEPKKETSSRERKPRKKAAGVKERTKKRIANSKRRGRRNKGD